MAEFYVGEIRLFPYPTNKVIVGWLPCAGQTLPISGNETLYAVIGTVYGGDGLVNFKLPDLRGRTPIHRGQGPGGFNYPVGSAGGAETVPIATAQMPVHAHGFVASTNAATSLTPSSALTLGNAGSSYLYCVENQAGSVLQLAADAVAAQPGATGAPHNNIQPTVALQYCIATNGYFPSPN